MGGLAKRCDPTGDIMAEATSADTDSRSTPRFRPALTRPLPHWGWTVPGRQTLAQGVRALGFWLAVAIPLLYVPLLVGGFAGRSKVVAFVGLLALNVVALVVGHDYRR